MHISTIACIDKVIVSSKLQNVSRTVAMMIGFHVLEFILVMECEKIDICTILAFGDHWLLVRLDVACEVKLLAGTMELILLAVREEYCYGCPR